VVWCYPPSAGRDHLVGGYRTLSASVGAVAGSGGSRMTIVARIAVVVGRFATWKVITYDITVVSRRYLGE
jgi:hypothetical protein